MPAIPDSIWEPGSLCWIGDEDGPRLEIEGGRVISMAVRRHDRAPRPPEVILAGG